MTQSNDLVSAELNKWTKSMLVDFIITQLLPVGVKLSEELSTILKGSSSNPILLSSENSLNMAFIFQSVIDELKSVALSNSKLHDKLNRLNMAAKVPTTSNSNTEPINPPTTFQSKLYTDTQSRQPAIQLTNSLSSSIKSKFIIGSQKKLDPGVMTTMLESELFNSYSDVTINKLVTRHPSVSTVATF